MKKLDISLEGLSVFIGMPTHRPLDIHTHLSLAKSWEACIKSGVTVELHVQAGSSVVTAARNSAATAFLESNHNRLFWIDSDMDWEPDDFMRLLCWSTELECVGTAYPKKEEPIMYCCSPQLHSGQQLETNKFGCIEMEGFGLGFTVVQRKVMEGLAAKAPLLLQADRKVRGIFREEWAKSKRADEAGCDLEFQGEDMNFFADVRALGYKVWLDPTIRMGHIGNKIYRGKFSDLFAPMQGEGNGLPNSQK